MIMDKQHLERPIIKPNAGIYELVIEKKRWKLSTKMFQRSKQKERQNDTHSHIASSARGVEAPAAHGWRQLAMTGCSRFRGLHLTNCCRNSGGWGFCGIWLIFWMLDIEEKNMERWESIEVWTCQSALLMKMWYIMTDLFKKEVLKNSSFMNPQDRKVFTVHLPCQALIQSLLK